MTKNRDFKTLVRRRMAKTGERYSTARAHVAAAGGGRVGPPPGFAAEAYPGLIPGVDRVGGAQPDVAAARNLWANTGFSGPDGEPLSEAMAFGLAGGVGFLYGVFEYGDTPTMTVVARNQSMPDPFIQAMFDRAGISATVTETTGAKKAGAALDEALAEGRPALCTVGAGALPYMGLPIEPATAAPHVVGVIGADGDRVWLDDRSPRPIAVERTELDAARAVYKPGKHRMVVIDSLPPSTDWPTVMKSAVAEAVAGFDRPPVPQFKSNVGMAGLTKWSELLRSGNKKGWRTVFGSDRRAAIGLSRLYDCVNHAYTSPDAGRPLFADFLDQAAAVTGTSAWQEAAGQWRLSGQRWREIASIAAGPHPNLGRYAELSDERARLLDDGHADSDTASNEAMRTMYDEQQELIETCDLSADDAASVYDDLALAVEAVVAVESDALAALV